VGEVEDEVFLAPREVALSRMELSTAAVVHKVPSLGSHVKGRFTSTILEESVENSVMTLYGSARSGSEIVPGECLVPVKRIKVRLGLRTDHCSGDFWSVLHPV